MCSQRLPYPHLDYGELEVSNRPIKIEPADVVHPTSSCPQLLTLDLGPISSQPLHHVTMAASCGEVGSSGVSTSGQGLQLTPPSAMQSPTSQCRSEPTSPSVQSPESSYHSSGLDGNLAAADSLSPKQVFVPCKVCGDKASGYHYGVTSCEGCKGFFRRSIQKQIEYRCLRDGKCLVMRLNRNRCQYCRFKKCLAVGMSRDSVRYGRVPKRSKSQDEQRVTTTVDAQEQSALESRQLAIYDVILTISQAHHAHCDTTEDKIRMLHRKPISLIGHVPMANHHLTSTTTMDTHRCQMFQNFSGMVTPAIQHVVEFAKRVPGFQDLSQDDQLVLIKAGFFEIWLAQMLYLFNPHDNTITLSDGAVITRSEMDIIYSVDLVNGMFGFTQSFGSIHLNDTEIGLFTAIALATADRMGLRDVHSVEKIQDQLMEALKLQLSRNHSADHNVFSTILMKLPELRALGTRHNEQLVWFRARWQNLRLPPLFAEIYDIQKSADEEFQ